jgi:hypothetical protein
MAVTTSANINLAEKYSKQIVEKFTKNSYVMGRVNTDFDWDGVRALTVYTPVTQELNDYNRLASRDRFGVLKEMEDTIQRLVLDQDKSFNIGIDRGNYNDQQMTKRAGKMMNIQIAEQKVPAMDKHALGEWAKHAGLIETVTASTKTDVVEQIVNGGVAMDNALVPDEGRVCYIAASVYGKVRLSPEFIGCDTLAKQSLAKGTVGTISGMEVVKVPDAYLPKGVQFMITHKRTVLAPVKIKTCRILQQHPDLDGWALQGRFYCGAFVLAARKEGVYVAVTAAGRVADPTVTIASNKATVTVATGATAYYTLDGSDPRNADGTRQAYSAAVDVPAGATIKVYQEAEGKLPSNVVEKVNAN